MIHSTVNVKTGLNNPPIDQYGARSVAGRFGHGALAARPDPSSPRNESARVFTVGDVRGGSLKRVASAVGEGAIAVAFVHQSLRE
jgi:hypothetical protein